MKKINEEGDAIGKKYEDKYGYSYDWSDAVNEAYMKEAVALFNKYANLYLVSTKDKCKIADVEISYAKEEECWSGYCETYYYTDFLLVFNDMTKVSAEVFFGSGFNKVIDAWMDFLSNFE